MKKYSKICVFSNLNTGLNTLKNARRPNIKGHMNIKGLIRNRTITKYFLLYEKRISNFTTISEGPFNFLKPERYSLVQLYGSRILYTCITYKEIIFII